MSNGGDESDLNRRVAVTAAPEDDGQRVDRFLAQRIGELTRSRIQSLIKEGKVRDDAGTLGDQGQRVKPGMTYVVVIPPPVPAVPEGESIGLEIVYEDAALIVIDKPAGLVVHPAAGHQSGTLVNALISHCGESLSGIGGVRRPGIVHRLDKETSGLLVVAKSDVAHQGLSEQFAAHGIDGRLERKYLALVWGVPDRTRGTIEARLGRSLQSRTKMAVLKGEAGRHAVTHYEVIETYGQTKAAPVASLVRLSLETGRTHQIRVHLAHIGHPVLGDPVYGAGFKAKSSVLDEASRSALEALGRQALHAAVLGFEHPLTLKRLRFESPQPGDMARLTEALRSMGRMPVPGISRGRARKN